MVYKSDYKGVFSDYYTEWHVIDSDTESISFENLHYDLYQLM